MKNLSVVPQKPELVTSDVVDSWYAWYEDLACRALDTEGGELSDTEREYEVCRRMMALCEAGSVVNDAVRERVLTKLAREQLYRFAPEGWDTLADAIRDALPSVTSRGYAFELATVAETIAPFCERHDLDVYESPARLGYVREASAALSSIITGPELEETKAERVREELGFIFNEATSRSGTEETSVRSRYRKYRGTPASATTAESTDGTAVMLLSGTPATIAAIRQRMGRLVGTWHGGTVRRHTRSRPSKVSGQVLAWNAWEIETGLRVVDNKTGEVIEEIEQ